jgi:hypothetical protein
MSRTRCCTAPTSCALVLILAGCPGDDGAPPILGTTGGSGFTTGTDEDGSGSSGSESGEPEPSDPCKPDPAPAGNADPVREGPEILDLAQVCNYTNIVEAGQEHKLDPTTEDFNVYVYRPSQAGGGWPTGGPWTPIFFVPGNEQFAVNPTQPAGTADDYYEELLPKLAAAGYVVFVGQPPGNPPAPGLSSGKRMSMLACMMLWANDEANGWSRADEDRIAQGAVIGGSSRGGAAVNLLTSNFEGFQSLMAGMEEYELCGSVAIAPRWSNGAGDTQTALLQSDASGPPYLVLQGALDPDTNGQGISAFDAMVPEVDLDVDPGNPGLQSTTLRLHDKLLLWFYGVNHHEWGGSPEQGTVTDLVADFAGAYYIEQFLEHQLHDDEAAYEALMLPLQAAPDPSEFPTALQSETLWDDIVPQYEDSGEAACTCSSPPCDCRRPLIYGTYTQGATDLDSGRVVIDALRRTTAGGDAAGLICGAGQPDDFLGASELGLPVSFSGFDESQLCHGPAASLGSSTQTSWQRHQTRAINVEWGATEPNGAVSWELLEGEAPLNLSAFSYITLRVANLADVTSTSNPFTCTQSAIDMFELSIELESETESGEIVTASLPLGPSVEQENRSISSMSISSCPVSQQMRTVRLPMRDFCDQGEFSPAALRAIRVVFPEDATTAHAAMIDSIEFTRDPLDPADAGCGQKAASWNCPATTGLVVNQVSCVGEPKPNCAPASVRVDAVPIPVVSGGGTANWVVHTPEGWVADVNAPTTAELAMVKGLCADACALEWADVDEIVTTDCFSSSSFQTPTLREMGTIGPVHRIPDELEDGSGIFGSQALACNLEGDCCETFDERVCAARPTRPTPAESLISRTEEYRTSIGGTASKLIIATPGDSVVLPLTGTAGYSFCPAGDTGTTCPFYLGSLDVAWQGTASLSDTCPDESSFDVLLGSLDIELVQPALGIASATSFQKAMPEGALHLRTKFVANGEPYGIRAVNSDQAVFLSAKKVTGLEVNDATFDFDLPCGLGTIPVTATLDLDGTSVIDFPPSVTITTASNYACPGTMPLAATTSDSDGDFASLRWYVDGVLIRPGTTSIPFTQAHTITAVGRDARGATTTKTKSVACL